jgi:methyltransferase family protein
MDDREIDLVLRRYNERLAALGPVPEALGWTKGRHTLRYHMLLEPWHLSDEELLDFGCGFGDMYQYCRTHLPGVRYHGYDLNPSLVAAGRERYPEADLRSGNALREGLHGSWDVIVASGLFNLLLAENRAFIEAMFDLFARHARKGFAANFLSNRVDYRLDHTYHADPADLLTLAYRYSNRVALRNDYMPFEFTVYVDLRKRFDEAHVVYPEFLGWVDRDRC